MLKDHELAENAFRSTRKTLVYMFCIKKLKEKISNKQGTNIP